MALYRFGNAGKVGTPRPSQATIPSGAVGTTQLDPFLLQGCKYLMAADQTIASQTAITFATKIFDNFLQVTGSNYQPANNGVMHVTARVRLTGTAVIPGTSGRLVLMAGSTRVAQGPECPVFTDEFGIDVINLTLDEALSLTVQNYFFVFEVVTNRAFAGAGAVPTYGSATVKAAGTAGSWVNATNLVTTNVPASGSYFQAIPVPQ